jgi:hypothetical protein
MSDVCRLSILTHRREDAKIGFTTSRDSMSGRGFGSPSDTKNAATTIVAAFSILSIRSVSALLRSGVEPSETILL